MIWLSEILLEHHELESFEALLDIVRDKARGGGMFFRMDIRPPFPDTPDNWEDRLESAFTDVVANR